ncbi:MAG: flavodoxin [Bacillota bacterium]
MSERKQVAIISASPKPPGRAASDYLAGLAADALRDENIGVSVINARETLQKHGTDAAFQTMANADALIIIFPLYIFCLPGITMRFLQMYRDYAAKLPARKKAAVYSVINCGFPEPEINEEASRVIGRFASAVGAQYCCGVLIGGGGMLTLNVSPAQKARAQYLKTLSRMRAEIAGGVIAPAQSVRLRVNFPRKLYFLMGNMGWRRQIRKNGGKKKDLYRRPYQR